MTRKHFEAVAITIGAQMRNYEINSAEWQAIFQTASLIAADFRAANPRFVPTRFIQFVLDVANYRRDLDGKAVAA